MISQYARILFIYIDLVVSFPFLNFFAVGRIISSQFALTIMVFIRYRGPIGTHIYHMMLQT